MSLADIIENYQASFVPPNADVLSYEHIKPRQGFARRDFPTDPKERRLYLKLWFMNGIAAKLSEGRRSVEVRYDVSEKEVEAIKAKQAQITQAALDNMVYSLYQPPRDPGMGWVFANNFPDQRQRMIDLLNLKHDIVEQLMILKTKSFPDKDDALLLFFINTLRPLDRQRFLTWLVGNDKSKTVLEAIVGMQPTLKFNQHAMDLNMVVMNMAGQKDINESRRHDGTGNYETTGGYIPNGLWRKMTDEEKNEADNLLVSFPGVTNIRKVTNLFAQLPMGARIDYSLPTPYSAHVFARPTEDRSPVTLAPSNSDNLFDYFMTQQNVDTRMKHILEGLDQ